MLKPKRFQYTYVKMIKGDFQAHVINPFNPD